jgi:hypothetical protein
MKVRLKPDATMKVRLKRDATGRRTLRDLFSVLDCRRVTP